MIILRDLRSGDHKATGFAAVPGTAPAHSCGQVRDSNPDSAGEKSANSYSNSYFVVAKWA